MLKSRDKNLFVVGYYFDASKGLHDLSKVSIKFPKKILDHPNCIKHVEIKGNIDQNALAASQDFSISGKLSQVLTSSMEQWYSSNFSSDCPRFNSRYSLLFSN